MKATCSVYMTCFQIHVYDYLTIACCFDHMKYLFLTGTLQATPMTYQSYQETGRGRAGQLEPDRMAPGKSPNGSSAFR